MADLGQPVRHARDRWRHRRCPTPVHHARSSTRRAWSTCPPALRSIPAWLAAWPNWKSMKSPQSAMVFRHRVLRNTSSMSDQRSASPAVRHGTVSKHNTPPAQVHVHRPALAIELEVGPLHPSSTLLPRSQPGRCCSGNDMNERFSTRCSDRDRGRGCTDRRHPPNRRLSLHRVILEHIGPIGLDTAASDLHTAAIGTVDLADRRNLQPRPAWQQLQRLIGQAEKLPAAGHHLADIAERPADRTRDIQGNTPLGAIMHDAVGRRRDHPDTGRDARQDLANDRPNDRGDIGRQAGLDSLDNPTSVRSSVRGSYSRWPARPCPSLP